ncbi:hypothetical protein D9757_011483 [Collybiopsis confluens]|uniref:Transmembrane protein n=1 Tax=Collybiopsis confluens TaxID=2823264 RepID=A0A8H5GVD8_9AGAR|nr:hypothetical protein D9757_011483 [Collybiopsis confluens]
MDIQARAVHLIFPSRGIQIASYLINILGIVGTTHFFSRRIANERFARFTIKDMTWARLLESYYGSQKHSDGILLFGVGLDQNGPACTAGIYTCILLYCASKVAVYIFLIERVHVVWSPRIGTRGRMRSPIYLLCLGVVALYAVVVIVMIVGRVRFLTEGDGQCFFGLKPYASYALFGYDMVISVVLTFMFLWPIMRAHFSNGPLKRLAVRTLIAGAVALATSSANALAMALIKQHEDGWLCLLCCSADIICNASAVFWVTRKSSEDDMSDNTRRDQESRFTSGRLTFRVPSSSTRNTFSRNFGKDGIEGVETQRSHGQATEVSVSDLIHSSSRGGVQVTITTETDGEGSLKEDFFSDGALQRGD